MMVQDIGVERIQRGEVSVVAGVAWVHGRSVRGLCCMWDDMWVYSLTSYVRTEPVLYPEVHVSGFARRAAAGRGG